MKQLKISLILLLVINVACSQQPAQNQEVNGTGMSDADLRAMLDTIWTTEQEPIRMRDEMIDQFGADSKEYRKYQAIYEKNHVINERKITALLENGWPDKGVIGTQGNRTICNVIQHADNEIRIKYLPMMKQAVKANQLDPQLLVRAEDRIATERGGLQIYGGQMKYYPDTKTFNVWPVLDPINIDKRRAEIGLIPIAEHLRARFDFEWNM
ncbi:MAG: hypothetical protein ACI92W_002815, partial [Paraglaciecola sp.]